MQDQSFKNQGISLVIFIALLLFTMVLHPAGGGFSYLSRASGRIIITHSIAIAAIPFGCIGFWGLTKKLGIGNFFSIAALAFILLGLAAVLLAATANGIVLPVFIHKYRDASPEFIESVKPILNYNFSVNIAFDYIYTGTFCIAILFWSIAILMTRRLASWIAYAGILLSALSIGIIILGLASRLQGLRIFFAAIILWILVVGMTMIKEKN